MGNDNKFAQRVFLWSGVYGMLVLIPHFFLEGKIGRDFPPAITHPEFFYGFVGVGLVWQILFLMIARDPVRFRPMMIPGALEKFAFGLSSIIIFSQGRLAPPALAGGILDLVLAALFLVAYGKTTVAVFKTSSL